MSMYVWAWRVDLKNWQQWCQRESSTLAALNSVSWIQDINKAQSDDVTLIKIKTKQTNNDNNWNVFMLSTSQATAVGLHLFLFLFRLVLIRETMRHDSSASRRKGRTPVRRPPMPTPGGSAATPSAPRRSGPSSEFRSCWASGFQKTTLAIITL